MRKIFSFAFLIFSFCSINAQEIKILTLDEAFLMASQNSKQLAIDSLKINSIDIKTQQTKNAMSPILGISAAYTRLSGNITPFSISIPGIGSMALNPQILNQYNNRFFVQQPIFQGLKNWNTLKALKQQKLAGGFDFNKDKEDLKWNIVQSYFSLYKLQQTALLLDSNIAQTQGRIDDLNKFKKAGLILNNDVMRAELQKTNLMVNKADVESNIEILNYNLNVLLGLNGTTKLILSNTPSQLALTNTDINPESAYSNRSEIKAQNLRSKAADYQIKASKSAYMPTLSFVGNGYYNNPNQRIFPQEAKFKATWDLGISLSWNIMQAYTARAVVNDAKNQKLQLDNATEQIKQGIQMEVYANQQTLKVAQLKVDLAQKAIEQATENRRILNNRFQAQLALLNDVLEADVLLMQAQTNLLNAQADVAIAYYKLQKSAGEIK